MIEHLWSNLIIILPVAVVVILIGIGLFAAFWIRRGDNHPI